MLKQVVDILTEQGDTVISHQCNLLAHVEVPENLFKKQSLYFLHPLVCNTKTIQKNTFTGDHIWLFSSTWQLNHSLYLSQACDVGRSQKLD